MQKNIFKKSVYFLILLSCTHIQGSLLQSDAILPGVDHTEDNKTDTEAVGKTEDGSYQDQTDQQADVFKKAADGVYIDALNLLKDRLKEASENTENKISFIIGDMLIGKVPFNYPCLYRVKFIEDSNNIVYNRGGKNLLIYDLESGIITIHKILDDYEGGKENKGFLILRSFLKYDKTSTWFAVSGLARESGYKFYPEVLVEFIYQLSKTYYIILMEYNTKDIITYNATDSQIVKRQKIISKKGKLRSSVSISPDNRLLACAHYDSSSIEIYDLVSKKRIHKLMTDKPKGIMFSRKVKFHPDGKSLMITGKFYEYLEQDLKKSKKTIQPSVKQWFFNEKKEKKNWYSKKEQAVTTLLQTNGQDIKSVEFYAQGRFCITQDDHGYRKKKEISIWNTKTMQLKGKLFERKIRNCCLPSTAIHPSQKFLAACIDQHIKIWHLDPKQLVFDLRLPYYFMCSHIDFTANGDYMLGYFSTLGVHGVHLFGNINAMLTEWLKKHEKHT